MIYVDGTNNAKIPTRETQVKTSGKWYPEWSFCIWNSIQQSLRVDNQIILNARCIL